jgi:hypothetical protein
MSGSNIYFRVKPNAKGNVIVAATNDSGEIVWTWHLWLLTEPEIFHTTHIVRESAWEFAGCNLGATSNEAKNVNSYGFYYQWGRKDPFPGAGTIGSTAAKSEETIFVDHTQKYVINPKFEVTFTSVRNSTLGSDDLAFITINPTTFVHYHTEKVAGDTAGAGTYTWAYNLTLAEVKALWSSSGTKTVYDPCPGGYRISTSNNGWANKTNSYNDYTKDAADVNGYTFSATDSAASGSSYYPATGYRNGGRLTNAGFSGYYWAANYNNSKNINMPYTFGIEALKKQASQGQVQRGNPIRCTKIK